MGLEFRKLRANEIDVRVGNITTKGYSLLLYKDARVDMAILDETLGAENWQRQHTEIKGNLYCSIGIWSESKQQWIWKQDCGVESFSEAQKGEASDSFKRAGFNVGIGRELYTAPFIWVNCDCVDKKLPYEEQRKVSGMYVKEIEYKDNAISYLVINDNRGNQVFAYGYKENSVEMPKIALNELIEDKVQTKVQIKNPLFRKANHTKDSICDEIEDDNVAIDMLLARLPKQQFDAINEIELNIVNWSKNKGKRVCDLTLKDVKTAIIDKKMALAKVKNEQ